MHFNDGQTSIRQQRGITHYKATRCCARQTTSSAQQNIKVLIKKAISVCTVKNSRKHEDVRVGGQGV